MHKKIRRLLAAAAVSLACSCTLTVGNSGGAHALANRSLRFAAETPAEIGRKRLTSRMSPLPTSNRVTVVGWVDGDAIDPMAIAKRPGKETVAQVGGIHLDNADARYRCFEVMSKLWAASLSEGQTELPFIGSRTEYADGLFTQAELVKSSANDEPPGKLTPKYIDDGDYRLLNDFQVVLALDGSRPVDVMRSEARIGLTPLPCGVRNLRNTPVGKKMVDWSGLNATETHPTMHNRRLCIVDSIMQVSQGRLGEKGRSVQRLLTFQEPPKGRNRTKPKPVPAPDELTPWIWSAISFDKAGRFLLHKQVFPTYYVYINGKLDPERTSRQVRLSEFLKLDAQSQFDAKSAGFDRGECR
jgi:hypothetical protein